MNQPRQRELRTMGGGESGDIWKPMAVEANRYAYNPNDPNNTREGYLLEVREGVGKNNSDIYCFHRSDENGNLYEKFALWADTVLSDRLDNVIKNYGLGAYCVIVYKGRKHKKGVDTSLPWSQTNSFHIWEVMVDTGAPAYDKSKAIQTGNPGAQTTGVAQSVQQTPPPAQQQAVSQQAFQQAVVNNSQSVNPVIPNLTPEQIQLIIAQQQQMSVDQSKRIVATEQQGTSIPNNDPPLVNPAGDLPF